MIFAVFCMASIYSFVRGAWPDLLANSSSPIGDRGTKVTDDNIGRTLSIIWKKNHIDAPYRLGGGSSRVFFFLSFCDRNASLIPIDYLLSPADHAISSANVLICALCSPVGVVVHAPLLVPNLSVGAAQG
jgi:hypothetical protein